MIYDLHLIMKSGVKFTSMENKLKDTLLAFNYQRPSVPALRTKPSNGRIVIHARIETDNLTEAKLQGLIDSFSLGWVIIGIRESIETIATYDDKGTELTPAFYNVITKIDKATILPFMTDVIDKDDGVNPVTMRNLTMLDTIKLPVYTGTKPIIL